MIKIRTFEGYKKPTSLNLTKEDAQSILSGEMKLPNGWYLHGRSNRNQFLNDRWTTQCTIFLDVAHSYGKNGSIYLLKPTNNAIVLNFENENTFDMNSFIKNLKKWYNKNEEETVTEIAIVINEIQLSMKYDGFETFEKEIRKAFSPKDVVATAKAYDNINWWSLLRFYSGKEDIWPDFIKVKNGAIVIPGTNKIEAINLTDLAKE